MKPLEEQARRRDCLVHSTRSLTQVPPGCLAITARRFDLAVTGITKNRQGNVLRETMKRRQSSPPQKSPVLVTFGCCPIGTGTDQPSFRNGKWGIHIDALSTSVHAPPARGDIAGATRTVTFPLEIPDFERLERLATEYNVGNATLCRQIIRQYLKRKAEKGLTSSYQAPRRLGFPL